MKCQNSGNITLNVDGVAERSLKTFDIWIIESFIAEVALAAIIKSLIENIRLCSSNLRSCVMILVNYLFP